MKNKNLNYFSYIFIIVLFLFTFSCKKKEYVKVYYLDRDTDTIIFEEEVEKGTKLEEKEVLQKEEGYYYTWAYTEAREEYNLDSVEDVVWIYGDVKPTSVHYQVYYNEELVKEADLAYNKTFNDYPALPENAVKKDENTTWNKENILSYTCKIEITYEIVEPTYEVKFYDGSNLLDMNLTYKHGEVKNLPSYEKEGYNFLGWFLSDLSYSQYTEITPDLKGNLKFYARVEEIVVHNKITLPSTKYHFTGIKKVETQIAGVYTYQPTLPTGVTASAMSYDWTSSNTDICTISAYSSITAKSSGYVILTATSKTDSKVFVNGVFKVTSDGVKLSSEEEANTITIRTVRFVGKDDELIKEVKVKDTGDVIYPTPPTYEGYTFTGWDKINYNITEDETIKATYSTDGNLINEYVGKKFSLIGDSISTYASVIPSSFASFYPYPTADVLDYNMTWWMNVINKLGGSLFINNSYSGTCVADGSSNATYRESRLNYTNVQGVYGDVCMILMGANDAASSSITASNFKEKYKIMLDYLKENAPKMELILLTLPISKLYSVDRQVELNNIIKDLASEYDLKLVDLASVDIRGNLVDSAHPNASGMKLISDAIIEALTTK